MEYLPAFLAATLGPAFTYQTILIILYLLLINIRKSIWHALDRR